MDDAEAGGRAVMSCGLGFGVWCEVTCLSCLTGKVSAEVSTV